MSLLTVRGGKLLLHALNHVIPYIEMCTSLVCNQVLFRLGQKGEAIQVSSGSGQLLLPDIIKVEKMHPSDPKVWDKVDVFFKVLKKEIEVLYLREKFPVTTHPIIFLTLYLQVKRNTSEHMIHFNVSAKSQLEGEKKPFTSLSQVIH